MALRIKAATQMMGGTTARPVGRPPIVGGYSIECAHARAHSLAVKPRVPRKLVVGNALWNKVADGLRSGLSPEQVAVWTPLPRNHLSGRLCHAQGALRTETIALLRFGHNKRRPRTRGTDRRGQIHDMVSIAQRPSDVAERLVPGHWEGDHIKGKGNRSQVGTLVERSTLYVALVKLENGTAQETATAFGSILERFDVGMRKAVRAALLTTAGHEVQHAKYNRSGLMQRRLQNLLLGQKISEGEYILSCAKNEGHSMFAEFQLLAMCENDPALQQEIEDYLKEKYGSREGTANTGVAYQKGMMFYRQWHASPNG